ncbi:IS200/IS605 family accessory protein TnpB-related protein [Vibrio breoganii]|uniref:IS200/IS605 family accessory protein TnpB-related protein n=1 Tax=Vibrio breoganii TaxID=553239 RepID=UPI0012FFDC2A|nr:IS200/IS605 family accessory protein TnpB-related protein [Vibrio breoganii]
MYRKYVRDLMVLINARWRKFQHHSGNEIIAAVESLIHPTKKRPEIKHHYFHHHYYKFPSYLRRVAIMDAMGQVRSFHSRFNDWLDSGCKNRPPKLTCATATYPSLYAGQCIKFSNCGTKADIKVFKSNDWVWIAVKLNGKERFSGKKLSPLLVLKNKKWLLSVPVKMDVSLKPKVNFSGKVLSVDVGINTTATCAVVDKSGTVHGRYFLNRSDKDREYRLMNRIRAKARKQTRHGNKLPSGFCKNDHRRLKQLADNEAHQISRRIVSLARDSECDAIAVEDLKGWRPSAGKKRSTMKAKFHRWYHRMLIDRLESKAIELGIRLINVYARGTSSNAYDGSGKVKRDKGNYALCQFVTGKRYNADLNAAYNIAARGILKFFYPKVREKLWKSGKPNACPLTGSPFVLSSIWLLSQT